MTDENIDVVRRIVDAWNKNDFAALDALIAPDFTPHTPGSEGLPPGLAGAKLGHQGTMQSFPDHKDTIQDIFDEGDRVVARCRMTATNRGGLPPFGIPANDKPVDFEWISIYRLENGKVAETWAQIDIPKLMQQLGAMPGM